MCGRYSLTTQVDALLPRLRGPLPPGLANHYAPRPLIRPGEPLLIQAGDGVHLALWGLLPSWVKKAEGAPRPIHARRETVAEKASFRGAWRHRRCLIPADAFFERGHRIARRDGALFWMGGLWERWLGRNFLLYRVQFHSLRWPSLDFGYQIVGFLKNQCAISALLGRSYR